MKCAVFSCLGLGDGLLALVLSHNLHLQGHETATFHPFLNQLQDWFPHLPIRSFPPKLEEFDRYFIIYERSDWSLAVLKECLEKYRGKTTVLNPIATPNTDYPFWEEGRFDGRLPFSDNLMIFCRDILKFPEATKNNGIVVPPHVVPRKHVKRVVIHPTSSRPGKNWSKSKFIKLAKELEKQGWDPAFIVGPNERSEWQNAPKFDTLSDMVVFVVESGYMIGNDSGIGHLASLFGLPTLTLCRNERTADFWKPAWAPGSVCLPGGWLPNIKWLRWRDHHWQWGISVGKVLEAFHSIIS